MRKRAEKFGRFMDV